MAALKAQRSRSGLDLDAPASGRAADAHEVAQTACWLAERVWGTKDHGYTFRPARHATGLHTISGRLHRLSERQCNEDLTCQRCQGTGNKDDEFNVSEPCPDCAGFGQTTGRTVDRLRRQAQDVATHYRCRAHFQTDPRGCALYLIPNEMQPASEDDSSYNRGHAVVRLGR